MRIIFKSILFYGHEIEKIMCLSFLNKCLQIRSIRDDLFGDESLIKYLKSDQIGKDLKARFLKFFNSLPILKELFDQRE